MNIIIEKNLFDYKNILFFEPVKNTIMNNGVFHRILYSNHLFTLNSLYFIFNLKFKFVEKYFNKIKYTYDVQYNLQEIEAFELIEKQILEQLKIKKKPTYKIKDLLRSSIIKIFNNNPNLNIHKNIILIKISGIWETDKEYGVTYKLLIV